MTSGDEGLRHDNDKLYSRLVRAPDGVDYLLNIEGWYWNSLDWLITERGWTQDSFVGTAWRAASRTQEAGDMLHPGVFKSEFETAFRMAIQEEIAVEGEREQGHTNDNRTG
jgi:hypothetical protein